MLWEREGDDAVAGSIVEVTVQGHDAGTTEGFDYDILLAVAALVGNGDGVGAGINLLGPQFFAGAGVEGAKAAVISGADEDQTAGGDDHWARIGRASIRKSFRGERINRAEGNMPDDVAGFGIDGEYFGPGWFDAGPAVARFPEATLVARRAVGKYLVVRAAEWTGSRLIQFYEPADLARVECGGAEDVIEFGIKRDAAPIAGALATGENYRHFIGIGTVNGERAIVIHVIRVPQIQAEGGVLGREIVDVASRYAGGRERRRLQRNGLRRRCSIARH